MKDAFHPDARMMGHIGPMDTYVPIGEFIATVGSAARVGRPELSGQDREATTPLPEVPGPCWVRLAGGLQRLAGRGGGGRRW